MTTQLCTAVAQVPAGASHRTWTLRDDNSSRHHSIVKLSESPLYLDLSWRETDGSPVRPVGIYRLDLPGLLANSYIREEPIGASGADVRLQVVRSPEGRFYIQTRQDAPRLLLERTCES